jgi:hypothetical protein
LPKERYAALFREGAAIRKLTVAFIRAMIMPRGGVRALGKRTSWSERTWEIYERISGKPRPTMFKSTRESPEPSRNVSAPM